MLQCVIFGEKLKELTLDILPNVLKRGTSFALCG